MASLETKITLPIHGRGTGANTPNRFVPIDVFPDGDALDASAADEKPAPKTQFLKDTSRTIIAYNDSPDVGFSASINPYRGCEHGCLCKRIIPGIQIFP